LRVDEDEAARQEIVLVGGASLAGEFLSLPAGPISAAIGVEYRDDKVEGAVATMNAQTTLDVCHQLLDANSEPCLAITRLDGSGQILEVRASNSNIGSLAVSGVDLTVDYTFGLGEASDLGFALQTGWLFERESQIIGAAVIDCAGYFGSCTAQGAGGSPDFKAQFLTSYTRGSCSSRPAGACRVRPRHHRHHHVRARAQPDPAADSGRAHRRGAGRTRAHPQRP
jgi:hypothetical protein